MPGNSLAANGANGFFLSNSQDLRQGFPAQVGSATKLHLNTNKRLETLAVIEAIAAISIWAVSFVFIKLVLQEISAMTLLVLRFALGAVLVALVAWRKGDFKRVTRADVPGIAWLGFVGITLQQSLQISGQATAQVSVAAFLAATAPAFTVALAAVVLKEKLRAGQMAGVALAALGAVVVATGGDFAALVRGNFGEPGNLLVFLSALVWAAFTIINKNVVMGRPSTVVTAGMFFFGGLFALPLFIAQQGWRELPHLSGFGWLAVLYVGGVSSAVAYLINSHALKHIAAARVAVIQNLESVIATAAAVVFLGERVTGLMLVGGAAIMAGVYWAERGATVAEAEVR